MLIFNAILFCMKAGSYRVGFFNNLTISESWLSANFITSRKTLWSTSLRKKKSSNIRQTYSVCILWRACSKFLDQSFLTTPELINWTCYISAVLVSLKIKVSIPRSGQWRSKVLQKGSQRSEYESQLDNKIEHFSLNTSKIEAPSSLINRPNTAIVNFF